MFLLMGSYPPDCGNEHAQSEEYYRKKEEDIMALNMEESLHLYRKDSWPGSILRASGKVHMDLECCGQPWTHL